MELFHNLEPWLKTFWFIAIPVRLIFLVQAAMTFIGADAADGIEADFEGDLGSSDAPFQLFSFRNLVNFLLGFSWSGISFYDHIPNKMLLLAVAVVIGVFFVWLYFFIIRQLQKLA